MKIFIVYIAFTLLEQKINLSHMRNYAEIRYFEKKKNVAVNKNRTKITSRYNGMLNL